MDENQIKGLVDGVVSLYRDKKGWKNTTELPDYHDTYRLSVEMMEAIKVHAYKGVFPDKLISKRSPNQTDAEFVYVKENYKQITLPVFVDLISTIQRAFNDNNWSIEFVPDDREDSLQVYLNEGLKDTPLQMPLEAWIKGVVPSIKEVDAMGCIAVKPWFIPTIETEDGMMISGDRFEPVPFYYSSDQLVAYEENEFYLFELKEKSEVLIGDRKVKEGLIYEFYDKNSIWVIRQIGSKKDYEFEFIPYYVHEIGTIPVSRLKGVPQYHDGELIWTSPFLNVVDILDDAVLDACNLRGIKATCVYPYRVQTGTMCDHYMEINGEQSCCNGTGHFNDLTNGRQITCPSCGGTGLKDRISPYGVMLLRPGSITEEGELKATQPAMYYVSPSIDTPEFLRLEIEKNLSQARAIMHLKTTNSEVQPADDPSATGRQLDEKALYSFIKSISDQIFELYEFVVDMIGMMRYGEEYEKPTITYPVNFDLKGEAEYLEEIGNAVEKGVPQVAVHALTMKYLQSLFYNSGDTSKAFEVIVEADRLFTMSDDDIILKQGRGVIAPYEVILHDSAVTFIRELIQEDPAYLDRDLSEKIARLIAKAQAKAVEVKPTTSAVSVVDRILNPNA